MGSSSQSGAVEVRRERFKFQAVAPEDRLIFHAREDQHGRDRMDMDGLTLDHAVYPNQRIWRRRFHSPNVCYARWTRRVRRTGDRDDFPTQKTQNGIER